MVWMKSKWDLIKTRETLCHERHRWVRP